MPDFRIHREQALGLSLYGHKLGWAPEIMLRKYSGSLSFLNLTISPSACPTSAISFTKTFVLTLPVLRNYLRGPETRALEFWAPGEAGAMV